KGGLSEHGKPLFFRKHSPSKSPRGGDLKNARSRKYEIRNNENITENNRITSLASPLGGGLEGA
ncbi:MAG: hypothetical protein Q8K69_07915, partial [Bacteroidota bacterium]|nr:hypothetical protein [Bacteroidota bacterium]